LLKKQFKSGYFSLYLSFCNLDSSTGLTSKNIYWLADYIGALWYSGPSVSPFHNKVPSKREAWCVVKKRFASSIHPVFGSMLNSWTSLRPRYLSLY